MKDHLVYLTILFTLAFFAAHSQSPTYTWNSTPQNTDWNNGANWQGGIVPTTTSEVVVNACSVCPQLSTNTSIARLTLNINSSISLASHTLSSGSINFIGATVFSNGGKIHTPKVDNIQGCSFRDGAITIDISPEGIGGIAGANTYYGPVTYKWSRTWYGFNHAHGGYETFKDKATFINEGTGPFSIARGGNAIFEKKVEFKNTYQGTMDIGLMGGITFKDTVVIYQQSTNSTRIGNSESANITFLGPVFVYNKTATTLMAPLGTVTIDKSLSIHNELTSGIDFGASGGKTILTSNATFHHGSHLNRRIYFRNFTYQNTSVPFTLDIAKVSGADPLVQMATNTVFYGEVSIKAPHIMLDGSIYYKKAVFEKIGGNIGYSANSQGGNVFHGETIIKNIGGYPMNIGQNIADIYHGDLSITHHGSALTTIALWSSGHQFNGNVFFTITAGSTGGITTGESNGAATLAQGKSLSLAGVSSGLIKLHGFTQKGSAPFSLILPYLGTAALTLGPRSLFEGELTVTAPHLYLNGATFNQQTRFTKTSAGNNISTGGNTFKGKVFIFNTASSGAINLSSQNADLIAY